MDLQQYYDAFPEITEEQDGSSSNVTGIQYERFLGLVKSLFSMYFPVECEELKEVIKEYYSTRNKKHLMTIAKFAVPLCIIRKRIGLYSIVNEEYANRTNLNDTFENIGVWSTSKMILDDIKKLDIFEDLKQLMTTTSPSELLNFRFFDPEKEPETIANNERGTLASLVEISVLKDVLSEALKEETPEEAFQKLDAYMYSTAVTGLLPTLVPLLDLQESRAPVAWRVV